MNQSRGVPDESEIEEYLNLDLARRHERDEPAEAALDANYVIGVELRMAIDQTYPPPPTNSMQKAPTSYFVKKLKSAVVIVLTVLAGWAVAAYFDTPGARIVMLAIVGYIGFQYHSLKMQELEAEIGALSDRLDAVETGAKAPIRQDILDDFEEWRAKYTGSTEARNVPRS
ncbi:hypothetical protein [Bauldia litoralis]|uniref:hypothetical protein n=1 Tax=Bauldia litoralis TaxID=665467 RepID=UPI003264AFFD